MVKYLGFILSFLCICKVSAQDVTAEELDAFARAAKTDSVMFQAPNNQQAYEEQMRERQAYEEQMENRRRAEEERLKALKPVNLFGNTLKIYAIINGEILTTRDMQDRVNAFVATSQIPVNDRNKEMVLDKVLQSAIDEKIKLQEAQKNGVHITSEELKTGFQNFAASNGLSTEQLLQMLKAAHVDEKVFLSQMKAEMAWGKLVQRKAAQNMRISQSEVKKAIENIVKDNQKQKFVLSEIVVDQKHSQHIGELVSVLRQDPRFELYAMQFSQSPSAKNGGRLGWVSAEQLNDKIYQALKTMKAGDISSPIRVGQEYYIIKLEQKYTPGVDKLPEPSQAEVMQLLQNKKMEEIANKYLKDLRNKTIVERKG
ncbi:MAG: peptidylprolyl isomerase [Alphaproteobacteria bacterium]|nr:peptidylprolyl isomerase [Alphaproteobacteria bacterium]